MILQDVAVMLSKGRDHPVFRMPVFKGEDFKCFQQQVILAIENEANPADAKLDTLIPGINERFGNIQSGINAVGQKLEAGFAELHTLMCQQLQQQNDRGQAVAHHLTQAASAFHAGGIPLAETQVAIPTYAAIENVTISPLIQLFSGHASVTSMNNEWYGRGNFENRPGPGGLDAFERVSKVWRKDFTGAEAMQFSRLKRVVLAIRSQMDQEREVPEVLQDFDELFAEVGNITTLVAVLKKKEYILEKRRGA